MITERSFVVFADDWGRHPSSCQHLFRRIAPRNRVVWVNTIGTRMPRFSRADLGRVVEKLREWSRGTTDAPANPDVPVQVLRPVMTPFDRWKPLRRLNVSLLERAVKGAFPPGDADRPILVTTIPNAAGVVGRLGEALSVYYCVDEFSEWPGADRDVLLSMEAELLERVDLVIATSETLFESKSARHARVRLLRHGVDWDRFRHAEGNPPEALANIPRPVVGFIGLADERVDVPRVAALARGLTDVSFVFVGPRQLPPGALDALDNVTFLPPVPYEAVPAVLGAFQVAILPYVVSELTERINPLKLRELLAAGLPIVATPLPEILRFAEFVRTARDADEWVRETRAALEEGRSRADARSASVRGESWEERAEEFSRFCCEAEQALRVSR